MSGELKDCKSDVQLDGKVAIVIGATSGIGLATAKNLSKRGARVIIAARNPTKLADAKDNIIKYSGNTNVIARQMDFESLSSIRSFADTTVRTEPRVDILINSIGALALEDRLTEDSLHLTMQVNYFGTFLLTFLLFPLLKAAAPSRVVTVSSISIIIGHIDMDHWNEVGKYPNFVSYANAKLATVLFTVEMQKRIKGSGVSMYTVDPGITKTEFFRNHKHALLRKTVNNFLLTFGRPVDEVATVPVFQAIDPKVKSDGGKHFRDCKEFYSTWFANDTVLTTRVWEETKRLVRITKDEDWELK